MIIMCNTLMYLHWFLCAKYSEQVLQHLCLRDTGLLRTTVIVNVSSICVEALKGFCLQSIYFLNIFRQEFMENECEALPGVAYPGVRDNRSTINTKTGYDDDDDDDL